MKLNLSRDIFRHRGELVRALRHREFEINPAGRIAVPSMNLEIEGLGVFDVAVNDGEREFSPNRLPTEMLNFMCSTLFAGASGVATWYIAPFSGNVTPGADLTGETFDSVCTEFDTYDEAARVAFVEGSPSSGAINNHSNRAIFTVDSSVVSPVTVYGAALLQASAKNDATAGQKIAAASRFANSKSVVATDVLSIGYSVTFTSGS